MQNHNRSSTVELYPIRSSSQFTPTFLAQAAAAGSAAFAADPVFRWIRPHATPDYAKRLQLYFEDRVRNAAARRSRDHVVLAVRRLHRNGHGEPCNVVKSDAGARTETNDLTVLNDSTDRVLGWAIWERVGCQEEKEKKAGTDFGCGLENEPKETEVSQASAVRSPDPAEDKPRIIRFNNAWVQTEKEIAQALRQNSTANKDSLDHSENSEFPHIKLSLIAVAPHSQRQGVGRMLVEWGLKAADVQGVPIVMGASPVGEGLYRKCGFIDLGVYLSFATKEEEDEYGRLNDCVLVRWPRFGGDLIEC